MPAEYHRQAGSRRREASVQVRPTCRCRSRIFSLERAGPRQVKRDDKSTGDRVRRRRSRRLIEIPDDALSEVAARDESCRPACVALGAVYSVAVARRAAVPVGLVVAVELVDWRLAARSQSSAKAIGRRQSVAFPFATIAVAVARTPWLVMPRIGPKSVSIGLPCSPSR